jgi:hypothetical protein
MKTIKNATFTNPGHGKFRCAQLVGLESGFISELLSLVVPGSTFTHGRPAN